MKLRYGPTATVLAALVMLSSGSVRGATMVPDMNLGSSALQEGGTLMAQTKPKKAEPSSRTVAPAKGTGTQPTSPPATVYFNCSATTCGCKGGADCFDLGSKDLCSGSSWNCSGNDCTCTKKAK